MTEKARSVRLWNVANIITIIRVFCIPAIIVLLLLVEPESSLSWLKPGLIQAAGWNQQYCFLAAFLFLFAAATDYLDGYIARKYDLVTNLGKLLDPLADKLLVMAAMIMLVEMAWLPGWMVVVIIGRELFITALRSIASSEGIVIAASQLGKFKTAFQVVALFFIILHYNLDVTSSTTFHPSSVGMILFIIAFIFTLWSGLDYLFKFWPQLIKK
jgi:CDP-diacylglycerol--glycerol-3-phosphate 3-phosphatidyltransferase